MTQITGKAIAGLIGFMAFGPAGLLFGLVLGHAFDRGLWRALQLSGPEAVHIMRAQFFETTFTLLGFVAKADGRVSEAEVAQTETLFGQLRLNAAQRRSAIEHFKTGSASGFDPAPTVARFNDCLGPRRQAQHTLMAFWWVLHWLMALFRRLSVARYTDYRSCWVCRSASWTN